MTERLRTRASYMVTRHLLTEGKPRDVPLKEAWGIVAEHLEPAVGTRPAFVQILWRRTYCPRCAANWDLCTCKVVQPAAEPEAAPEQTKLARWYAEAGLFPCTNCEFMTTKRHNEKPWCFRDCCPKDLAEHSYANYEVGTVVTLDKVRPLQWWTFLPGGEPRWLRGRRIFRNGAYLWLPFNQSEYRESSASPDSTEVTLAPPPEYDIDLLRPGSVFVFRPGSARPAGCFDGLYKVLSGHCRERSTVTVQDLATGHVRRDVRCSTRVLLVLPRLSVPSFTYIGLVEGDFHVPCDNEHRPLQDGNVCLWTPRDGFTRWRKLKLLSTSWGVSAIGNLPCRIFECEDVDEAGSVFHLDEYTLVVPAKE